MTSNNTKAPIPGHDRDHDTAVAMVEMSDHLARLRRFARGISYAIEGADVGKPQRDALMRLVECHIDQIEWVENEQRVLREAFKAVYKVAS